MQKIHTFLNTGTIGAITLIITGLLSTVVVVGLLANPFSALPQADMRTEADLRTRTVGEQFQIRLIVESSVPVNAFAGDLSFNRDVLEVSGINYNTSIADLWVKEPWYSNGEGSISFAGGTTKPGGFQGTGTLITVNFTTLKEGQGFIGITDARILQHDGLGTETTLKESIDSVFTIENQATNTVDVLRKSDPKSTWFSVQHQKPTTDLNADEKQTIADMSIFMMHMVSQNMQSDFNEDGKVGAADLSIILDK